MTILVHQNVLGAYVCLAGALIMKGVFFLIFAYLLRVAENEKGVHREVAELC